MPLPTMSALDQEQIMKSVYNEADQSLRVDADIIANLSGPLEVSITQQDDSIRLGDGTNLITSTTITDKVGLDVNLINEPINVVVVNGPTQNLEVINQYNEINSVSSNVISNLITYTVPSGKTSVLQQVSVSGENIAKYDVFINSNKIDTKRTFFGGNLNTLFEFKTNVTNTNYSGILLNSGDVVNVTVIHTRPDVSNHEARLQTIEMS